MSRAEDGLVSSIVASLRRCLGQFLPLSPPDPAAEVMELLSSLEMTPRQIHSLYSTFQQLRQFDSLTLATTENEVSVGSTARLVRTKRHWVKKILVLLLDLAGFSDTVSWDGYLFVFIQFCTLSKVELCQVLFFIISKHMKSWTVHYLTSTQLEEFYEDYQDCPVPSFNTGSIDFSKLALAKYRMSDFIELMFRFSQLINPCLHLQRSLQQALPSLRFWSDYDRVKVYNRKITIDFFRHKKITSMFDLFTGMQTNQTLAGAELHATSNEAFLMDKSEMKTDAEMRQNDMRAIRDVKRSPAVVGDMPLPLSALGVALPPREKRQASERLPEWLEEYIEAKAELLGPQHASPPPGAAAAAAELAQWYAERGIEPPNSMEAVRATIHQTYGPPKVKLKKVAAQDFEYTLQKRAVGERVHEVQRHQELEFIRRNRRGDPQRDNMVDIVERSCPCELIDRPVQKVQGHL